MAVGPWFCSDSNCSRMMSQNSRWSGQSKNATWSYRMSFPNRMIRFSQKRDSGGRHQALPITDIFADGWNPISYAVTDKNGRDTSLQPAVTIQKTALTIWQERFTVFVYQHFYMSITQTNLYNVDRNRESLSPKTHASFHNSIQVEKKNTACS